LLDGSVTLVASEGIASYEQHHPELGTAALVNLRSQIVAVAVQVAIAGSALRRYSGRERDLPSARVLLQVVVISWAGPGKGPSSDPAISSMTDATAGQRSKLTAAAPPLHICGTTEPKDVNGACTSLHLALANKIGQIISASPLI